MDISLGLYPDASAGDLLATIRHAEARGLHCVWLADSHVLWREAHVLLGAAAQQTHRIRLATCVTNPITRHPTVTAAAFVTLAELSAGRAVLGIGVGDSALRTVGLKPASMAELTHCVAALRERLAGPGAGAHPCSDNGGPLRIAGSARRADAAPEGTRTDSQRVPAARSGPCGPLPPLTDHRSAGARGGALAYGGTHAVPIAVAASGPKMLCLAGAIADTVVLMNGVAPELVAAACERIDAGARDAGRDPRSVRRVVWAACHVAEGDASRSIAMCRYNVARTIQRNLPGLEDARTLAVAEQVREHYDYARHGSATAGFASLIPDDLVPRFTFAGSADTVRAQIRALDAIGIDEVALAVPLDPDSAGRDGVISRVSRAMGLGDASAS